ncbi:MULTISPECIES: ABC transporter permease [unclassified Mangrovimonas]|uniref:ABC transporter permease n=1 Tax=unclassified Mangrovimonas TaxID=2622855 RepID=UPI0006B5D56F|nr:MULTISPECIES: ABC transporter permease [unclassified Mangrovimonas]NIK90733.1 ABC transporter permease [Mangrovimonas sp. CR14]
MDKIHNLDITKFLPHREPFLMVDHVLSIDDQHVSTSFHVTENCLFTENGFFNEVGLVENAAQTCSSIVGKTYFDGNDANDIKLIGYISAIKKVSILSLPKVNSTIVTNAKLISRFDTEEFSICTLQCKIVQDHKELVSCELNLVIQELT